MVHPALLYLQVALSIVIIGSLSVLYQRIQLPDVKFRLRFLIAAFTAFLIGLVFHIAAVVGYQPGVSLFLEHVFGVVFFLLFGATGLLHFLEKRPAHIVVMVTYFLLGVVILSSLGATFYYLSLGTSIRIGARAIIFSHAFQLLILLLVTGIILWRIYATRSSLSLLTIHRRYPFGIAAALMMFAIAAHILAISTVAPFRHLTSFSESLLVLPALVIVAFYILMTFKNQLYLFGTLPEEKEAEDTQVEGVLENLNHIIRHVYYTPLDVGIGAREVLFSEFLESTKLAPMYSKGRMELRRETFLKASNYDFLYSLSEDLLRYFDAHKEMVNSAQFHRLVEFLDHVYARGAKRGLNFKAQWSLLSRVAKNLGEKADKHLARLSAWDPETTISYFKERHPTGIRKLDVVMGGLETHQFLLNISTDIPKLRILRPVIKSALLGWRNVIYVTADPAAKIKKDLEEGASYLGKERLRVIALMPKAEPTEEGITTAESLSTLVEAVIKSLEAFPLGTTFLVVDLNPIVISEPPPEVHGFLKILSKVRYKEKLVVCAFVSKNVPPLSMDILREEADVVIKHELIDGEPSSIMAKPDIGAVKPLDKDLFKVLRLVHEENTRGKKPSIGEISARLSITPKTAKKRVVLLRGEGLITVEKRGRYKVIEITEDGRQAFLMEHKTSTE